MLSQSDPLYAHNSRDTIAGPRRSDMGEFLAIQCSRILANDRGVVEEG